MQMRDQVPQKDALLAGISKESFAVCDTQLYLDSHPCDEDALAFFQEHLQARKQMLEQYAKNYGPLTIDTADDCMSRSFDWVETPWPWESVKKGGCR